MNTEDNKRLDEWLKSEEPIDRGNAIKALKEVKQILDSFGVTFFLRQGTCLGAIRDNDLLPWDDDVDMGSVIGFHGVTEKSLDQIVVAFRNHGFLARIDHLSVNLYIPLVKYSTRVDWLCYKVVDDYIIQFPFQKTPLSLFTVLKEITFLKETFLVPNPPEEYLRLKYGENWKTPKKPGDYEEDV
ncbi:MAG: LicD family protein, partial [Proteobacteria bacterium]|nr:LicD family protein [Pseudomonadota bacterium]